MADRYEAEKWERPDGLALWRVIDLTTGEYVREPDPRGWPQVFASEHVAQTWINREHAATP